MGENHRFWSQGIQDEMPIFLPVKVSWEKIKFISGCMDNNI